MAQRYTFTHPTDHQQYHADLKTAQLLHDLKVRDRGAYEAVFTYMKAERRLQPGIAPRLDAESTPIAPAPVEHVDDDAVKEAERHDRERSPRMPSVDRLDRATLEAPSASSDRVVMIPESSIRAAKELAATPQEPTTDSPAPAPALKPTRGLHLDFTPQVW